MQSKQDATILLTMKQSFVERIKKFGDRNVMISNEEIVTHHPSDYITLEGAKRFYLVYEDAEARKENMCYLDMLAYNLGMRKIEEVRTIHDYAPVFHEDIEGGTLPGELVRVVTSGWKWDHTPIVRAKVRRLEND